MTNVTIFDCVDCKHRKKNETGFYCAAFPDGIPNDIIRGTVKPHKMGQCNNGVKFEDKRPIKFRTYSD